MFVFDKRTLVAGRAGLHCQEDRRCQEGRHASHSIITQNGRFNIETPIFQVIDQR